MYPTRARAGSAAATQRGEQRHCPVEPGDSAWQGAGRRPTYIL